MKPAPILTAVITFAFLINSTQHLSHRISSKDRTPHIHDRSPKAKDRSPRAHHWLANTRFSAPQSA